MRDRDFHADVWDKTAAEWAALNPYLPKNDYAVEKDTGRAKIGIGQRWLDTPYVADSSTIGLADVFIFLPQDGDVLRFSDAKWRNHPEANLTDGGSF